MSCVSQSSRHTTQMSSLRTPTARPFVQGTLELSIPVRPQKLFRLVIDYGFWVYNSNVTYSNQLVRHLRSNLSMDMSSHRALIVIEITRLSTLKERKDARTLKFTIKWPLSPLVPSVWGSPHDSPHNIFLGAQCKVPGLLKTLVMALLQFTLD